MRNQVKRLLHIKENVIYSTTLVEAFDHLYMTSIRADTEDFFGWKPHCCRAIGWCKLDSWKLSYRYAFQVHVPCLGLEARRLAYSLTHRCPFGIGTTEDIFHAVGNFSEQIDVFMSIVIPGAMLTAVRFSIVADILSGPLNFVVSNAKAFPESYFLCTETPQGKSFGLVDSAGCNHTCRGWLGIVEAWWKEIVQESGLFINARRACAQQVITVICLFASLLACLLPIYCLRMMYLQ